MKAVSVGDIEIWNQAENKITVRILQIYPAFENQGETIGVTFGEFMKWYEKMLIQIFNNLDCNYSQVTKDKGAEITIEKK